MPPNHDNAGGDKAAIQVHFEHLAERGAPAVVGQKLCRELTRHVAAKEHPPPYGPQPTTTSLSLQRR